MPLFSWLLPVGLSNSQSVELNLTTFAVFFRSQVNSFLYIWINCNYFARPMASALCTFYVVTNDFYRLRRRAESSISITEYTNFKSECVIVDVTKAALFFTRFDTWSKDVFNFIEETLRWHGFLKKRRLSSMFLFRIVFLDNMFLSLFRYFDILWSWIARKTFKPQWPHSHWNCSFMLCYHSQRPLPREPALVSPSDYRPYGCLGTVIEVVSV